MAADWQARPWELLDLKCVRGGGCNLGNPLSRGVSLHRGQRPPQEGDTAALRGACPARGGSIQGPEVECLQLQRISSYGSSEADTDQTNFSDTALGWFMPLRSRPRLYFISVVTVAPSRYEATLPAPAVSLGREIFMKGEAAALKS